jgi:mycofactocin precursor
MDQTHPQTETAVQDPPVEGAATANPAPAQPADELVEADLLVEDVSIDGMCGVY